MVGDAIPGFVPGSSALVDDIEAVDLVDDVAQAGIYRGPARDAVVLNQRIGKPTIVEVVGNTCRDRVGIVDAGRLLDVVVAIARRQAEVLVETKGATWPLRISRASPIFIPANVHPSTHSSRVNAVEVN